MRGWLMGKFAASEKLEIASDAKGRAKGVPFAKMQKVSSSILARGHYYLRWSYSTMLCILGHLLITEKVDL